MEHDHEGEGAVAIGQGDGGGDGAILTLDDHILLGRMGKRQGCQGYRGDGGKIAHFYLHNGRMGLRLITRQSFSGREARGIVAASTPCFLDLHLGRLETHGDPDGEELCVKACGGPFA